MAERDSFKVYAVGFVCTSVCTSLNPDEAARWLEIEHPAGTRHGWMLTLDTTFADGTPHPAPCNEWPDTHKHYLFKC